MRISVIGAGYVGLVSGVGLARMGHHVTCVDVDAERVRGINGGRSPFFEAGLDDLLASVLSNGRFLATTVLEEAVRDSRMTFIAVGTPFSGTAIELGFVERAAAQVGEALSGTTIPHDVVVKSTVVPGTTDRVVGPIVERASGRRIGARLGLAMNPEFLSEGTAVEDFMRPDRIVVGARDPSTASRVAGVYDVFPDVPVLLTNNATAEMIKYASNAVLATLISFSNETANLCAALGGIDMRDVSHGVALSQYFRARAGDPAPIAAFLEAGCGFGGSCLPKDVRAIVRHGEAAGEAMPLLRAVLDVNDAQPNRLVGLLRRHRNPLSGLRASVLGLSFKPGTDDIRESPAVPVIETLLDEGAIVTAYDPVANHAMARRLGNRRVRFASALEDAVRDAEAVVVVTAWEEFNRLPELVRRGDRAPVVVDGRRMLDHGLFGRYEGIGR